MTATKTLHLTDANGTLYEATPEGVWSVPGHARVRYQDEDRPDNAVELYSLRVVAP